MTNHILGASLGNIDINSDTNMAYVPDLAYEVVFVIDGNSVPPRVLTNITTEYEPWDVAVDEATNKIYVSHNMVPFVTVIDGKTNKVNKTISLGEEYNGRLFQADIAVNSETNTIFLIDRWQDLILVIDGYRDKLVQEIPINAPWKLAVNERSNLLYVLTDGENATLTTIDTTYVTTPVYVDIEKYQMIAVHGLADDSHIRDIAVDPVRNKIYLTSYHLGSRYYENQLIVIDGNTGGESVTMDSRLSAIAVNPTTNVISIINQTALSEAEIERLPTECFYITDCYPVIPTSIIFMDGIYHQVLGKLEITEGRPTALDTNPNTGLVFSSNILPSSVTIWNSTKVGGEQRQQLLPMLEDCNELGITLEECTEEAILQEVTQQAQNGMQQDVAIHDSYWIMSVPVQLIIGVGAAIAGFIAFIMLRKPNRMH